MKNYLLPYTFIFLFSTSLSAQNPFIPRYDAIKKSERCYTVTSEANNQFGAVWWADKVDFSSDTLFNFVVYMGDRDGNGADGLAFVMHQDPRDTITDPSQQVIIGGAGTWNLGAATGDDGGGLGFAMHTSRVGPNTIPGPHGPGDDTENHKIQASVAVELDTWNNRDVPDGNVGTDANGNNQVISPYYGWDHTAVIYNGDLYGSQQIITDAQGNTGRILPLKPDYAFGTANNPDGSPHHNIEDDRCYLFQIRWEVNPDGTQTMQLWADVYNGTTNTDGLQMIMTHNDDMINNVFGGDPVMRFGFTGSTGGAINEQTICLLGENLKPFAADDYASVPMNSTSIIDVESNDNDPDGDQLHVPFIIDHPKHGLANIFDSLDINYMRYTPNANYAGNDTISYVTCDVNSTKCYVKCDTAIVVLVVGCSPGKLGGAKAYKISSLTTCKLPYDGALEAGVINGTDTITVGYTFEWYHQEDPKEPSFIQRTGALAENLDGREYSVIITENATGCDTIINAEVTNEVINASISEIPVSCTSIFLKAGIRIEIDFASTTLPGPYEAYVATTTDPENGIIYQIPDNGIRTILNLDKDFYNIIITSSNDEGCNYSESIPVFSGAYPLDFEIIDSDSMVSCIGDIGSITVGDVVGDPDTTFIVQLISESNVILETYELHRHEFDGGFTIDETNTDKLVAGKYYIKMIQNQNECAGVESISDLITIYEPLGQLGFEVLEDEVSLADRPTGYIIGEVIPSGGSPYEARIQLLEPVFEMNVTDIIEFNERRSWEEVSSTGDNLNKFPHRFDSLWAGLYEIVVRDAYGCSNISESINVLFSQDKIHPRLSNHNKSYFNSEILGSDTACANSNSDYDFKIEINENKYFDSNSGITGRVTQYNPLQFQYDGLEIQNTFTFDFWVKPEANINMKGESSVCYGGVSVPLANSNQNWAVYPGHVNPNFGVGLSIGNNGVMVGEHSGNILVSRLSHNATINDWTHIAVVYKPDSLCLYINGNLAETRSMHCRSNAKFVPSSIAGALYSNRFRGAIDEFRVWDKPLSMNEVMNLKDKKLVNEIEGLRYYASFDNGQFIKALGDLGADSIKIADVTPEENIKASTWDLDPYMGTDVSTLVPFTIESLDYLWSNGSTNKTTSITPSHGDNKLIANAYNSFLSISDTIIVIGEDCGNESDIRYIRFRSYYSEDNSQANVYEIQAYKDGVNVGLNKSTQANSHEGGNTGNEANAVDGDRYSRWSSDRDDPGPDSLNQHYITIDLLQNYDLDSIILNIEGFDSWEQTFDLAISGDSMNWKIIGNGINTTGIFTYLTTSDNSENLNDLEFSMKEESVATNQQIQFPISVKYFQNILTTQYTISWDPLVVKYQGVQDFGLQDLDAGSFHLFEPGKLTLSWNPSDLQPESVADSTVIFNIAFEAIGTSGQSTDVAFTDVPTSREVSDGDGNILDANYINGKITIIDEVVLGGYIKTQKGEPLVGVEVELIGATEQKTTVDEFGWYSFKVIPSQEYHIAPLFDTEADDGVTTLDIVIMHWHILGKKYIMSNHDLIASDVNGGKSLTTLDLAETRAVILHNKNHFRERNAVEFVNKDYTGDPDVFEYKNYLDIIPTQSHLNLNFTAVKLGDAGRNWKAKKKNAREQQLEEIDIILEKGQIAGNKVIVPLKTLNFTNMVGLQFTMEWDPAVYKFDNLSTRNIEFFSNVELVNDGKLTVIWNSENIEGLTLDNNTILSNLEFNSLDDSGDPKIEITSDLTPALAFNSELETFKIKSKSNIQRELIGRDFTIYPNPANDVLNIAGIKGDVTYSIISATGKTIISGNLNTINQLDISELKRGVYIFQTVGKDQKIIIKKFIKQ